MENKLYQSNRLKFFSTPNQILTKNKLHIYSAGVLPFQIEDNTVYLCLGKDKDGLWSDFGGKVEPEDKYSIKETAAREFYEESHGAFLSLDGIRNQLLHESNFNLINSESMSKIRYYMFILQIPKLETDSYNIFHTVHKYLEYIKAEYQYLEKVDIGWISLDTLLYIIDHNEKYEYKLGWPLKKVFRRTLLNHRNILTELKHKEELYT